MKWKIEKRVNTIKDNVRQKIQGLMKINEEDKLTINLYSRYIMEHWDELYRGLFTVGDAELVKGNHKHFFSVYLLLVDLSVRVYEVQQNQVERWRNDWEKKRTY